MPNSTCSIAECEKSVTARGWCDAHYSRWKRYGDPTAGGRSKAGPGSSCSIDGCGGLIRGWGYCRSHYRKHKLYGDPHYVSSKPARMCTIEGCGNKHRTGGYCSNHHEYNKRNGTPYPPLRNCTLCGDEFASIQTKQKMCNACSLPTQNARHGVSPSRLAERDGTECGLCGEQVDLDLSFPDPMSPSVDHVIPWSLGGTHDLANLQLAHLSCNCRKGNRVQMAAA